MHDDRLDRSLDRMFEGIGATLIMAVVRHVITEFALSLEELHNDSTTVSFYGAYDQAGQESENGPQVAISPPDQPVGKPCPPK